MSHEVDWVVQHIKTMRYNAEYVLIGDSVGLQLSQQYQGDPRFAVLATNQAIETTGQYFLIRRFLEKNPPPKAVIFTALPFIDRNLDQVVTENFVLRVFTKFREIYEVFSAKYDLTMAAKMLAYNIFFSYKHKLQLQKKILGYTNANMYSGVDLGSSSFKYDDYSLLKMYKEAKLKRTNSSVIHFEKLVSLLREKGIDFYYIPVPIKQDYKVVDKEYKKMFLSFFPEMRNKYPNICLNENYEKHPRALFSDSVHFNKKGLISAHKFMRREVDSIIKRYR